MKDCEVIGLYFRNKIFYLKNLQQKAIFFKEAIFKGSYYSDKKKELLEIKTNKNKNSIERLEDTVEH